MEYKAVRLINELARKCLHLKDPIHVIAVCSGGKTVGKYVTKYLKSKGKRVSYHEVWTNIVGGKATVWKSNFNKKDYRGTALIVEDVIWKGTSVNATKKMLKKIKKEKVYTAVLLDYNKKADFSVYS